MLDFVILDIDLAFNRYCLWSWDYSVHALRYPIVFLKKKVLLNCFVLTEYAVFIWILGFHWLMQVHGYKYLQDYKRPFNSCKPNEEWTHIALLFYNESEKSEKEKFLEVMWTQKR